MSRSSVDSRPFIFKQFQLLHHLSTMKVGMDATILGIWASVYEGMNALDVGCGSGVISLLLASRAKCRITAIDIDKPSIVECAENFAQSKYHEQLSVEHNSLQNFCENQKDKFDLVVSNPPFFTFGKASANPRLGQARHTISLTYNDLINYSFGILKPNGVFSIVIPYSNRNIFVEQSKQVGFYLHRQMIVFPKRGMPPNRIYLCFSKDFRLFQEERLSIREENGEFTVEFKLLVNDFYL